MQDIRIGLVGANPHRSWAKDSHVPAIQQLPGVDLAAVLGRSDASAREAASAFGAPHWFTDVDALCASNLVDVIAVCVKVPDHAAIVQRAIAAGKHVYCEWPLGRTAAEAAALAKQASDVGVHVAIGLQGRLSPAARRAKELIAQGRLGRLRSAQVTSTTAGYAARLPAAYAYLNDPANGANLTTILGGHTLDLTEMLLGALTSVDALAKIQHPEIHLTDSDDVISRTTPDQLFILGLHASGCVASIEVGGDRPPATPFTFEVIGDDATLRLVGGHPHGFQAGELALFLDGRAEPLDAPLAHGGLHGAAVNVGEVYAALARDIRDENFTVPDFAHAARLTRLVDSVSHAAASGERQLIVQD